jgi:hypothetical protein
MDGHEKREKKILVAEAEEKPSVLPCNNSAVILFFQTYTFWHNRQERDYRKSFKGSFNFFLFLK